jgi:agmatine deiminase
MRKISRRACLSGVGILPFSGGALSAPLLYHMPIEHEHHARTFMQWPVDEGVYGAHDLARVQKTIAEIANAISNFEPVVLLMAEQHQQEARQYLSGAVEIWPIKTNDLWCRDSGPTFVKNQVGELAISHLRFNGWGNKQAHDADALIAPLVAQHLGMPLLETGLVGEQGGVEHDGAGTLMAHASCWVNSNRNSGSAEEIGNALLKALGGSKMIWTPGLLNHDITDFHIDALARFVGPGRVLIQLPEERNPEEPYAAASYQTYDMLRQANDANGRKLDIIVVPDPVEIRSRQSDFVSSYVNFYVCNGGVIAAQFGDRKADEHARGVLADLYPGRQIINLNVDPLGESGGGIHCATQQQPFAGQEL